MTHCIACGHSLRDFDSVDLRKKVQKRHADFWDVAGDCPGILDVIQAWLVSGVVRSPRTHCIACGCPFRLGLGSASIKQARHNAFWESLDVKIAEKAAVVSAKEAASDLATLAATDKVKQALRAWVAEGAPETPGCYLIRGQVRVNVSGLRALGLGAKSTTRRLGMALRRISVRRVTTRLPNGRTPKLWIVEL